jgi:hypothetical protein
MHARGVGKLHRFSAVRAVERIERRLFNEIDSGALDLLGLVQATEPY